MIFSERIQSFFKTINGIIDSMKRKNTYDSEAKLWEIYFDEPYSTLVLGDFKAYKITTTNIREIHYSESSLKDVFYIKLFFIKHIKEESLYGFMDLESYHYMENELLMSKQIDKAINIATNNNIPILHVSEIDHAWYCIK